MKNIFQKENHLKYYYNNIALNPLVLSKKQYKEIKNATESIGDILEKTVKIYFRDSRVQDFFQFNARQKNVIQDYRKEMRSLYLSRFDGSITSNGGFKFLEFNVNHPGGTERLDHLSELIKDFSAEHGEKLHNQNDIFKNYLATVKKLYKMAGNSGDMVIAYGSKLIKRDIPALEKIAQTIKKELKIRAHITHFENLTYNGKAVLYKNKRISLIYRSELLQQFWQYDYKAVKPVLAALKDKKVIMYNLPQAYICGSKNLFALWHEKWFEKNLTKKEIESINNYIPQTYAMDNNRIKKTAVINDKDKWVIKPIAGFGGNDVFIGKEYSKEKWQKIVNKYLGSRHFILQQFIKTEVYNISSLDTCTNKIEEKKGYLNISPWYIDGKMRGISARYCENLVINVKRGGGIMAVLVN